MCKKRILTLNEVLLHRRDRIKYQEVTLATLKALKPILKKYRGRQYSPTIRMLIRKALKGALSDLGTDVKFQCFQDNMNLTTLAWVQFDLLSRKSIETIGFAVARKDPRAHSYRDLILSDGLLIMEIREKAAELALEKLKEKEQVNYRNMVTIWNQAWLNVKRISEQAVDLGLAEVFRT
ncbi:MAG TPA: hypothetical protein ENI23_06780 [bacterium]|nr:hypothetical protein [bacterium]